MLGSANFRAGPVMAFVSGNLCYQIEHHLYPDLPSNRYAQIAQRVQATYQYLLPCARSSNWPCRTGSCAPPPTTLPKPPPKTDSTAS